MERQFCINWPALVAEAKQRRRTQRLTQVRLAELAGVSTPREIIYAMEIFFIATAWFCGLTIILSHPYIKRILEKAEKYIARFLGIFLIGFGVALAFVRR